MVSINWGHIPWLILLVCGLALVLQGGIMMNEGAEEYTHWLPGPADAEEIADAPSSRVFNFSSLSPRGKEVFRKALVSYQRSGNDEGEVVIGENPPPEFTYGGHAATAYFIRYNGTYYRLVVLDTADQLMFVPEGQDWGFMLFLLGLGATSAGAYHFVSALRGRLSKLLPWMT